LNISSWALAIAKLPVLENKEDLKRFLGMLGYYRNIFSSFAEPLTAFLKGGGKIIWTALCQDAFEKIKVILWS